MKKYLAIILGAVFVLGFAASAFALHAEIPAETQAVIAKGATQITIGGELRFRGEYQNNTVDFNKDKVDNKAYYDSRVRLSVDAQITPNTEGFVQVEAGSGIEGKSSDLWIWGNGNSSITTAGNSNASGIYAVGDSKRGQLNILQAWILHTGSGLGIPAGIKVGHMPLALGNSLFFDHTKFGDDAIVVFADPIKELHLVALTAKFREGNISFNDDANAYVGLFAYNTKEFGISGDATYVDDQTSHGGGLLGANPIHFWNFGLRANASVAGFGIMGDVEMQTGKVDVLDLKFRGYAGMVGINYKIDPVKLVLEGAYGSGDDNSTDGKIKAFVTSLSYIQHYTYVYDYRTINACGQTNGGGLCNTMYIKGGIEGNFTRDLSGLLNVYWLRAAKEFLGVAEVAGAPTTSKSIGWEFDAKVAYKIDRNLQYWVEGGYLVAGKFFDNFAGKSSDNPYAIRNGIQLSF